MIFSKPYGGLDWCPIPFETLQGEIFLTHKGDKALARHGNAFMQDTVEMFSCNIVPGMRRPSVDCVTAIIYARLPSPSMKRIVMPKKHAKSRSAVSVPWNAKITPASLAGGSAAFCVCSGGSNGWKTSAM